MRYANDMVDKQTVSELARLAGIEISDDELDEVTNRFSSLIQEMDRLKDLDLTNIHPVAIFPEDGEA
jgi:aspartyl/glutamyl-tRNA(Asn/Gln) amidotransferase C subunit